MKKLIRTERGWVGHFICAGRCLFRRNTLLEYEETRIVISTVGLMLDIHLPDYPNKNKIIEVGIGRYFETMAFHAKLVDNRYWDADVSKQIYFDSPWAIDKIDADDKANDMHEIVVTEISDKLSLGYLF